MEQLFDNTFLIKTIRKNYKQLLVITFLSGAAAAFFSSSLFITPKFKSVAVLYPSNISPYSNESQTEQMVQLLQSADIRNKIFDTLNLYAHYKIDKDYPQKLSMAQYEFLENVTVSKTEFESIEIDVLDEEPKMAAKIIEMMITLADSKIRSIQKQKSFEVLMLNKSIFDNLKNQLDSVDTLIKSYSRKFGFLDFGIQTKEAQRAYYKGLEKNSTKETSDAKQMLNNFSEHGYDFVYLTDNAASLRKIYASQQIEYYNSLKDYQKVFTYNNIVSKPIVSDRKAYPVRWIIVSMSIISTLFLGFLILLSRDKNALENN